ncbi:AAA family ATPase [Maribacter sp. 6B07]|uniref:AAA family ATPase n=1 Tax=Maribacter sp. 6B07 TaxID=2045442 RepID=UPI000C0850F2|nr:AAA family ATPase [Maribacter sp. 6B07]PHN94731.1 AAA family ATPase [Maribacter sp. 6B07]
MELKKAEKKDIKLRIGLSGASGSGKSYSALLLAYGITGDWTKIAVIDTENGSSNLYAHLGRFNVLKLKEPYSPENFIKAIKDCENASMEVIIIDSITHEWKGVGGCLDLHRNLGGRFQDWNKITPRHQKFISSILNSSCHIITTVRRKIEYVIGKDDKGKLTVCKLGTKEETRNDFQYELTLNFEFTGNQNQVRVTKDRTGLFSTQEFIISNKTGLMLVEWCMLPNQKPSTEIRTSINSLNSVVS